MTEQLQSHPPLNGTPFDEDVISLDSLRALIRKVDDPVREALVAEVDRVSEQLDAIQGSHAQMAEAQADAIVNSALILAELDVAREAADAANRAKSDFVAKTTHEIRTPMTAILGYAEILSESMVPGTEQYEQLSVISQNGQQLLRIINNILDLSKLDADGFDAQAGPTQVLTVVNDVIATLTLRATQEGLYLRALLLDPIPETITTDAQKLHQILINLIGNALKFTTEGGISLTLQFLDAEEEPQLRIEVVDTGVGMAPEQAAEIFEPFVQVEDSSGRRQPGTGLGLTISKKFASLLGGDLTATSEPGKGSVFSMTIPVGPVTGPMLKELPDRAGAGVEAPADIPPPLATTCSTTAGQEKSQPRVLVAEDNRVNQILIRRVLSRFGTDVTIAENGEVAIDLVRKAEEKGRPFEIVFMDLQMPILDGYAAIERLRAMGVTTPIVALTANVFKEERDRCRELGCDAFATKPYDRSQLQALIQKYSSSQDPA